MSLFTAKEWWSVRVGHESEEEFDIGGLVVGNIDNATPVQDKICVGSLSGNLRIYYPSKSSYSVSDLVYEESFGDPILQLLIGRFIGVKPETLALAVLHPHKLVVYELMSKESGETTLYRLEKCYTHNLGLDGKHFSAFNMTSGTFGGRQEVQQPNGGPDGYSPDSIMVQSMDGKLQIFEQTAEAFTVQMTDCLIPGPLTYLERVDAFVTGTFANRAECYRYQVLASAQTNLRESIDADDKAGAGSTQGDKTGAFGLQAVRSAMVEWGHTLGESVKQLVPGRFSKKAASAEGKRGGEVIALCDHSLFLLKEGGGVAQQKRLDRGEPPTCCHAHTNAEKQSVLVVGYRDGLIQIFCDFVVAWTARLDSGAAPVDLRVASFGGQQGLLVVLDESGRLSVNYLGTSVATSSLTQPAVDADGERGESRELDYDTMEAEHRELLRTIRASQMEQRDQPREKLLMRTQVSHTADQARVPGGTSHVINGVNMSVVTGNGPTPGAGQDNHGERMNLISSNEGSNPLLRVSVRLFVSYTGKAPLEGLTVLADAPTGVLASPQQEVVSSLAHSNSSTPLLLPFSFFASNDRIPSPRPKVSFTATYFSPNREPRAVTHSVMLPMLLACCVKSATKRAPVSLVLSTPGSDVLPLTTVFDDFLLANSDAGVDVQGILGASASMAIGFQFYMAACDALTRQEVDDIATGPLVDAPPPWMRGDVATASILASKKAGRYRVQADCPWALAFMAVALEQRLAISLSSLSGGVRVDPDAKMSSRPPPAAVYEEELPMDDYLECIERHFYVRMVARELSSHLNDRSHQFRLIQKRLLARYRDKNPTALNSMDVLLKETYEDIMSITQRLQHLHAAQQMALEQLEARGRLMSMLVCLKYSHLTDEDRAILEMHLCPMSREGYCEDSQGWEETVEASLTFLLKTTLAKNAKDAATLPDSLDIPLNVDKLKRHVMIVIDRLGKGGRLTGDGGMNRGLDLGQSKEGGKEEMEWKD